MGFDGMSWDSTEIRRNRTSYLGFENLGEIKAFGRHQKSNTVLENHAGDSALEHGDQVSDIRATSFTRPAAGEASNQGAESKGVCKKTRFLRMVE